MKSKKLLTSLKLILPFIIGCQTIAGSLNQHKTSRAPSGYVAGGEGGTVGLVKISKARVQEVIRDTYFYDVMFYHFNYLEEKIKFLSENFEGKEKFKIIYNKLYKNPKFGNIIDYSKKLELENFDFYNWGSCPSDNEKHADMSVISKVPLKICVSTWNLSSKLYESNIFSESAYLLAHEMMHVFDLDHEEIEKVQNRSYSKNTFRSAVSGKAFYDMFRLPTLFSFNEDLNRMIETTLTNSYLDNCRQILFLKLSAFNGARDGSLQNLLARLRDDNIKILKTNDLKTYQSLRAKTFALESYCLDNEVSEVKMIYSDQISKSPRFFTPSKKNKHELLEALKNISAEVRVLWENSNYFKSTIKLTDPQI